MKIDILIPTYNRINNLSKNLTYLINEIRDNNLRKTYSIVISDNCSIDKTPDIVKGYIDKTPDINIRLFRNEENLGLEQNVVNLFLVSNADFVICLGDDDYLGSSYLKYCYQKLLDNPGLGCIIPGLQSINYKNEVEGQRTEEFAEKEIKPGYEAVFDYSHFAHQMSGLVFKRKNLIEYYLRFPEFRNPYLFIYLASYCLYSYSSLYAPGCKTSVNVSNKKDWDYNEIGLLDEVFKSYYLLGEWLSEQEIKKLMIRFVVMHSYRLIIKPSRPLLLLKQYLSLVKKARKIKGFRKSLLILLIKEYLKSFRLENNFNKFNV